MLRWLLYIVLGIGGLVALVAIIGLMLPKGHRALKTTTLDAPPDAVFAAIADVGRYQEWRKDVQRIELLPDDSGRRMFREHGSNGAITYRIEEATRPTRLVFRIADPTLPFGGTWTHELKATASGGTELTTTEDGEVYNPIFRFMSRYVISQTASLEKFQAALRDHLATRRQER